MTATRVVVIGVSSSGKTTVGVRLADQIDAPFLDADDFHTADNVEKMAAGRPLDDADRAPWVARLRDELAARDRVVLACSALKRSYRDVLRATGDVQFVYLDLGESTARTRAEQRTNHFMKAGMIEGQFGALEPPTADETDVIIIDARPGIDEVVSAALRSIVGTA